MYRPDKPSHTLTYQGWQLRIWDTPGIVTGSGHYNGVPIVNMAGVRNRAYQTELLPRRAVLVEKHLKIFQPKRYSETASGGYYVRRTGL